MTTIKAWDNSVSCHMTLPQQAKAAKNSFALKCIPYVHYYQAQRKRNTLLHECLYEDIQALCKCYIGKEQENKASKLESYLLQKVFNDGLQIGRSCYVTLSAGSTSQ